MRVVRVLPDEPAIDKTFDYLVPDAVGDQVRVGTRVRIALGRRRIGGWVVAADVVPDVPVAQLRPLAKVSGYGPTADLIELAEWAAWRWAGRPASFLRTASPDRNVYSLPKPIRSGPGYGRQSAHIQGQNEAQNEVWRVGPGVDLASLCVEAARDGNALILCPETSQAARIADHLKREGIAVALHPDQWADGAAGATVVGTRAAAWTPVSGLARILVLDEHDEGHAQTAVPTWHARDVATERARRAGVPCVLVSPCPTLEAFQWGRLVEPSRSAERAAWPVVDVVDRRDDDPRTGLISPTLLRQLQSGRRIVCVLNRTGRARLLACSSCGEIASCEACDAAVAQPDESQLVCPRCEVTRPVVCRACGGSKLKLLRQGVSRIREDLEALVGEPVAEVSAQHPQTPQERVVVGTEAVLHQLSHVDIVAFLDLDQELLAPRYRAVEQAFALVVRAARVVGGKDRGGRLLLQTRLPRHEVVLAALHADPTRVATAESARRSLLRFPPETALAEASGAAASKFVEGLRGSLGVEVLGPSDGRWLIRADDHRTLCDALAATPRPTGRLRVAVDPLRL